MPGHQQGSTELCLGRCARRRVRDTLQELERRCQQDAGPVTPASLPFVSAGFYPREATLL